MREMVLFYLLFCFIYIFIRFIHYSRRFPCVAVNMSSNFVCFTFLHFNPIGWICGSGISDITRQNVSSGIERELLNNELIIVMISIRV